MCLTKSFTEALPKYSLTIQLGIGMETNRCDRGMCIKHAESLNMSVAVLILSQTRPGFHVSQYNSFENTVGKGEIARHEQFLLFPQCFLQIWRTFCHFHRI